MTTFEDGNGRTARALADLYLARADGTSQRFYSMSAQIRLERSTYYQALENMQKSDTLNITPHGSNGFSYVSNAPSVMLKKYFPMF